MSTPELRVEVLELLAEVRSAGRGASRSTLNAFLDARLPALVAALDGVAETRLPEALRARCRSAVSAACDQARETTREASPNVSPAGLAWPWRRDRHDTVRVRRGTWVWAPVLGAALILLGFLLFSVLAPERPYAPKDRPGVTGSQTPLPQPPSARPDGPVVERGPETDIEARPAPRSRTRDRVARREWPVVGEFADNVVGEPLVFAPGSKEGVPATPGMPLKYGSRIDTGDFSRATVRFADGTTLALDFNTVLRVAPGSDPIIGTDRRPDRVVLESGRVTAVVAHVSDRSRFTVETPVANAEVLGTEFGLGLEKVRPPRSDSKAEPALRAVLQVKSGRVAFYNGFGRVLASAMTESTADEGAAPTEPQRLRVLKYFRTLGPAGTSTRVRLSSRLGATIAVGRCVLPDGWTGLSVARVTGGEVRVVGVVEDSPAREAGVRVGDILLALDGRPVETPEPILRASFRGIGSVLNLSLLRDGAPVEVSVRAVAAEPPMPRMAPGFASRLGEATLPALLRHSRAALQPLHALVDRTGHPAAYNNLGVVYETLDSMGPAIRSYQAAVRFDPNTAIYRRNLGLALQKIGNNRRCVEELETALALEPRYHDAILDLVEGYHVEGRVGEALALLDSAQLDRPNCAHLLVARSFVLFDIDRGAALEAAKEAVRLAPDSALAHYQLGTMSGAQGGAEASFRKAIELLPGQYHFHVALGNTLRGLRRPEEAEAEYRKAIEFGPGGPYAYFELGRLCSDQGRYGEGERLLRKSVSLNPTYPAPRQSLGILLTRTQRFPEAESEFRKVLELDPLSPTAHMWLARTLERTGRPQEAEAEYRVALKLAPLDSVILSNFANFLMNHGHLAEAETVARRAIEIRPKFVNPHLILAFVLDDSGRLEEAEQAFRKVIELDPRNADAHVRLGQVLMRLSRHEEAEPVLRKSVQLDPREWRAHQNLAMILYDGRRFEEAEAAWRKVLERVPANARAHGELGLTLEALGRREEAVSQYRKALELEPHFADGYRILAELLDSMGRFNEAMLAWENGVNANPENASLSASLGWSQIENHRWEAAVQTLRKCLELDSDGPATLSAMNNLARALIHFGELAEAEEIVAEALRRKPEDLETLASRSLLLAHKGEQLDTALELAKRGTAQQDPHPWHWEVLGFVHFKRGEWEEAIESLKKAADGYGKVDLAADALVTLGQVYEAKKDVPSAIGAYRRALAIEADNRPAAEALKRLGG